MDDLRIIYSCFGVNAVRIPLPKYQPEQLAALMRDYDIISSVRMNKITGRLDKTGVLHWIVPVSIWLDRFGYGTIDIYNPFPNRVERYSWAEFVSSAGWVYGTMKGKA